MADNFGIDDAPACPKCKTRMNLTRRAPHPLYEIEFERQTFVCRLCPNEFVRCADRQGELIG